MKKKKEEAVILSEPQENEEIQVAEEESKGRKILNGIINVILVVAIVLAAMCTYVSYVSTSGNGVPSILGIRVFSIQTDSMYPTLLPGDLIFGSAVNDPGELRKGDIITYWTVINGERVLNTHTIHEIYDGGGYLIFATKGDNNTAVDALTVHESAIVAQYSGIRVASLGKVFDYLQTSTGFLLVIVIPVFLFFLFHLVQFFRVLFEYQNVKNRIRYEQERGRTEDLIEQQQMQQKESQAQARAKMEAELRERLKAEILANMAAQAKSAPAEAAPAAEEPAAEEPVAEAPVAEEVTMEGPVAEEVATEEPVEEPAEAPAEEPTEEPAEESAEPAAAEEKPALDEAAIEAIIAQQRAAIEAELREKIRAEMLASQAQTDNQAEDAQST